MTAPRRILITPRSVTRTGHPTLDRITQAGFEVMLGPAGRQPTTEQLLNAIPSCVGYLAGVEPITDEILAAATQLRVISRNGVGIDNIDLDSAKRRGIAILRADGANARGVAELAIGSLFALARHIPKSDRQMKAAGWERTEGIELADKTLGIIGCGRIGQTVARLAGGLGLRVLAYDPFADARFQGGEHFRFVRLEEVIENADFLTLHCPPLSSHRPLLGAEQLRRTRRGVRIVNTARHDLIDPNALLESLNNGQVAGAALDVFEREPPVDLALVHHPHVIATPHIGGLTRESIDRAMGQAVDNLLSQLSLARP